MAIVPVPRSLLVAYVVIGWVIVLFLTVCVIYAYYYGNSLLQHSLYMFSGEVLLWLPASEFTGLAPSAGPIAQSYNENTAQYLGDAMSRYMEWYANRTMTYMPRSGTSLFRAIFTENGKELSCVIVDVPSSDALLVLFKGTTSHFEWNVDFTYQTTSPEGIISGSTAADRARAQRLPRWLRTVTSSSGGSDEILIHKGFAEFYFSMRGQIMDAIDSAGRTNVYICGHSLGAGVGNVCLFDILDSGKRQADQAYCVTIGSPRVGNPAFARFIATQNARLYQLRNTADVIPLMPLAWTPSLKGEKRLYEYEHAGVGMLFENRSNNLKGAHMLESYQTHMLETMLTPYSE